MRIFSRFLTASAAACIFLGFHSQGYAATITPPPITINPIPVITFQINLVTICTSAQGTTQASKCTAWQYNVYTPSVYIESYPQVSPGPAVWTDPAYEYRLGSTITPTMGVKVCPQALRPGTSYNNANADPCPNNKLVAASSVIPQAPAAPTFSLTPGTYGPRQLSVLGLSGQTSVALGAAAGATIHYTMNGSTPGASSPTYSVPILLTEGAVTKIQAIAFSRTNNIPSPVSSATYTVPHFPSDDFGEPVTDLMTLCISATAVTQASQCKQWQYNFFSPGAYLESYPQASPGPALWTDPAYEYRLGSTITPTMGVKVCPTTLLPGVSFSSAGADVCSSNIMVAASTVIPTPSRQSSVFLYNNESSQDSCGYYQRVGLVQGPCDLNPDGSFKYGLTMAQWETNYYVPLVGTQTLNNCANANVDCVGRATFVNVNDLNFVRAHTAAMKIDGTAGVAFVCNFRGPDFYQDKLALNLPGPHVQNPMNQAAVDAAVQNGVNNVNPLPCVAFDYGAPDAPPLALDSNSNPVPYIRMMVFTPAGNLASAVDLDGRGPKSVPNACSACHGVPFGQDLPQTPGHNYQMRQGASYIPFDMTNLEFSSSTSPTDLTQSGQEGQIKILNKIVLNSALATEFSSLSTQSISTLIHGWYGDSLANATQSFYSPPAITDQYEIGAYEDIYVPYCRSCHVANHVDNYMPPTDPGRLAGLFTTAAVCAASANPVMPNSKMGYDRLWTSHIGPTATPALDVVATALVPYMNSRGQSCTVRQFSNPIN